MPRLTARQLRVILCRCTLLIAVIFPVAALADNWQLQVGAQTGGKSQQALAFLPNEIWIHSGDSITWAFVTNEVHTVTFLTPLQVRPNRFTGCATGGPPDGRTPDFSVYDGTACVNSGIITSADGQTYTVVFPAAGNFKLVCLAHPNMTATIHVLPSSTPLPHDQAFYDKEAARERAGLLSDAMALGHNHSGPNQVTAGVGHIIGNGGGTQTASVMRFMNATK
ncbi:MAG TPA: plastocyanin/azurin family copper-binding protein, partial [Terriglobales bacterium]|nr:plastocyanin/azurin family copper-binding protein [Terriglobales bacterium]